MRCFLSLILLSLAACSGHADRDQGDAPPPRRADNATASLSAPLPQPTPTKAADTPAPSTARPDRSAPAASSASATAPASAPPEQPMLHYRAVGTEPFWAASVVAGSLTLARPGEPGQDFSVSLTEQGAVRRYKGPGISMRVDPGPCSDGMSDSIYPDRVQIAMGDAILKGCGGEPENPGRPD